MEYACEWQVVMHYASTSNLINNIPALVQIMAWRRPGDKPLSEPMMVNLLTHICVTRPQWINRKHYGVSLRPVCTYESVNWIIIVIVWRRRVMACPLFGVKLYFKQWICYCCLTQNKTSSLIWTNLNIFSCGTRLHSSLTSQAVALIPWTIEEKVCQQLD